MFSWLTSGCQCLAIRKNLNAPNVVACAIGRRVPLVSLGATIDSKRAFAIANLKRGKTTMFVQKMPQLVLSAITIGIFCFALPINSEAAKEAKATKKSLAVESTSQGQGDETAVKAQVGALNKSLANGDAKTLASLWTEDGDYIGVDGAVCKGRAALEKRFTGLMAENDKQQVELLVDHVRFPAANVGLLEGVVRRNNSSEGPVPET